MRIEHHHTAPRSERGVVGWAHLLVVLCLAACEAPPASPILVGPGRLAGLDAGSDDPAGDAALPDLGPDGDADATPVDAAPDAHRTQLWAPDVGALAQRDAAAGPRWPDATVVDAARPPPIDATVDVPREPVRWDFLTSNPFRPSSSICGLADGHLECIVAGARPVDARVIHRGERIFDDGFGWLPRGPFSFVDGNPLIGCALDLAGEAHCWSADPIGAAPAPPGPFKQVSAAGFVTCAIRLDDSLECWSHEPGAPEYLPRPAGRFVQVESCVALRDSGAIETFCRPERHVLEGPYSRIAPSGLSCRLTLAGEAECDVREPAPPGPFSSISLGESGFICALRADTGLVSCWAGEPFLVAEHSDYDRLPAVPLRQLVTANDGHCGLDFDGFVWCWGGFPANPYTLHP